MARRYTIRISGTSGERFYADASRDAVAHGWSHGRKEPGETVEVYSAGRLVSRVRWDAKKYRYMREQVTNQEGIKQPGTPGRMEDFMIYKKQDIDRAFTETVTEFLAQGFQINAGSRSDLCSRQYSGEIACVDLCKEDILLRVRIYAAKHERYEFYALSVGQRSLPRAGGSIKIEIINNSTFETTKETCFYPVDEHSVYGAQVFGDEATAKAAQEKRQKRQVSRRRELPARAKVSALRWLRNQPRMKTCRLDEIESVSRLNKVTLSPLIPATELECYEIKARGRIFKRFPRKEA